MSESKETKRVISIPGWVGLCIIGFAVLGFGASSVAGYVVIKYYPYLEYVKSKPNLLLALFDCSDQEHCVVKDNPGGNGDWYLRAALTIDNDSFVRIEGYCNSACAIFADYVRPRACITKETSVGFHKGVAFNAMNGKIHGYFSPTYNKDIMLWVYAHGDFPNTDKGEKFLEMKYPDTQKFWPLCPTEEGSRKGDKQTSAYEVGSQPSRK